jgi:hypothetical protein
LLAFRENYGGVPHCNIAGTNVEETNEFDFFSRKAVEQVLEKLETEVATGGAILQ